MYSGPLCKEAFIVNCFVLCQKIDTFCNSCFPLHESVKKRLSQKLEMNQQSCLKAISKTIEGCWVSIHVWNVIVTFVWYHVLTVQFWPFCSIAFSTHWGSNLEFVFPNTLSFICPRFVRYLVYLSVFYKPFIGCYTFFSFIYASIVHIITHIWQHAKTKIQTHMLTLTCTHTDKQTWTQSKTNTQKIA